MIDSTKIREVKRLLALPGRTSYREIARASGVSRQIVAEVDAGRRPDYETEREKRAKDLLQPQGVGRCPGCGMLCELPCRLCHVRAIKTDERERGVEQFEATSIEALGLVGEELRIYEQVKANHVEHCERLESRETHRKSADTTLKKTSIRTGHRSPGRLAAAVLAVTVGLLAGEARAQGLIEFRQDECQPCRAIQPAVARLQASGVRVIQYSVGPENPMARTLGVVDQFNVLKTPTFIAVSRSGREVGRIVGGTSEAQLRALARRAAMAEPADQTTKPISQRN
jgi:hypothetical protein